MQALEWATSDTLAGPEPVRARHSRLGRFLRRHGLSSLQALRVRARRDPAWFWEAVVDDIGWPFFEPYRQVLDLSPGVEWARWFVGGVSNVALAALDRHVASRGQVTALICENEAGDVEQVTYRQLWTEVNRLAWGLQALGIEPGDRVALYLPMIKETVVAMMACAKIGAVIVPLFSGYGEDAVATRLLDARPRALVTCDGYRRRGRTIAMKVVADKARSKVPDVPVTVVVRKLGLEVDWRPQQDYDYQAVVEQAPTAPFATARLDSEALLMVIYTSGTTGKPKGAAHVHLGFPLKATQDLWHAFDLWPDDVLWWYTDMGWMMGPWMVYGGLITGATIVLFDGTPDWPHPGRLWEVIDRHRVSIFGISPTVIRSLMAHGDEPVGRASLASLRVLGASGEPWNPQPWRWFREKVGHSRCPIINYSGGTEISGGIVSAFYSEPQKCCAFNGPVPGIDADVVNDQGESVREAVGELVIRQPWPGMTRGFWSDPQRYHETYWERLAGLWVHGDFAYVDAEGFWYILGRSDDTIKVAGKRIGPAEIESALVAHPEVVEAAVIGVPDAVKGEALVAYVVTRGQPQPALADTLADWVAERMGKPLRPKQVFVVAALPKTRNGKIVRRAIKAHYLGTPLGDISALENPESLQLLPRGES